MFNHYSIYFKKFVINKCIFLLFSPLPVRHSKGLHSVPLFPVDLCRFPDEDEPEIFRTFLLLRIRYLPWIQGSAPLPLLHLSENIFHRMQDGHNKNTLHEENGFRSGIRQEEAIRFFLFCHQSWKSQDKIRIEKPCQRDRSLRASGFHHSFGQRQRCFHKKSLAIFLYRFWLEWENFPAAKRRCGI